MARLESVCEESSVVEVVGGVLLVIEWAWREILFWAMAKLDG